MKQIDAWRLQEIIKKNDIVAFANEILGLPTHEGQNYWLRRSTKTINILKPANQWGKTTAEAIKHIYHAVTKKQLDRFNMNFEDKQRFAYKTLNFGKTYEVAKGVSEHIVDITEGRYLLPTGEYNNSLLKGWAITSEWNAPKLPQINWWNNSATLIRSYDGLGESFKRLRLAFISGDECGDIPELNLFLNGTLLPRLFFFKGSVDLVGTSQPKGVEYEDLAAIAEEDMKKFEERSMYFIISYNSDPQMATVYRNDFMPKEGIESIENIADPELKKQIVEGQYIDWKKHLYSWAEVQQMFTPDIPWDPETGLSELPQKDGFYVFSVDLAASGDETSCTCLRYRIERRLEDGTVLSFPHRIAYHKAWKGSDIPLPLQYELIKEDFAMFKKVSPLRTKFVYDAGSLGGKNAEQAFLSLHGFPFPPKKRSYAEVKAEGMTKVKEVLGRGREFVIDEHGKKVDKNREWGGVRASSKLKELKRQLEVASKDDDKLKNDQYTSFMQAVHFVETRTPKRTTPQKAVDFNLMR